MRCLLFVLAETKISPKLYTPRVQRGKGETDDVAIGPPKGSGHPDNVRRNTPTQVAGPTEAAVCGSVVITRIQPTSKCVPEGVYGASIVLRPHRDEES